MEAGAVPGLLGAREEYERAGGMLLEGLLRARELEALCRARCFGGGREARALLGGVVAREAALRGLDGWARGALAAREAEVALGDAHSPAFRDALRALLGGNWPVRLPPEEEARLRALAAGSLASFCKAVPKGGMLEALGGLGGFVLLLRRERPQDWTRARAACTQEAGAKAEALSRSLRAELEGVIGKCLPHRGSSVDPLAVPEDAPGLEVVARALAEAARAPCSAAAEAARSCLLRACASLADLVRTVHTALGLEAGTGEVAAQSGLHDEPDEPDEKLLAWERSTVSIPGSALAAALATTSDRGRARPGAVRDGASHDSVTTLAVALARFRFCVELWSILSPENLPAEAGASASVALDGLREASSKELSAAALSAMGLLEWASEQAEGREGAGKAPRRWLRAKKKHAMSPPASPTSPVSPLCAAALELAASSSRDSGAGDRPAWWQAVWLPVGAALPPSGPEKEAWKDKLARAAWGSPEAKLDGPE